MGLHRDLSCPDASDTYFENPRRIACIYKKLEILEKKILSRHGTDQYKNSEANITSLTDNSFKNSYLPFPRLESYPAKQSTIQLAHSKRYYEKVKETSSMSNVDLQNLDTIDFTQEEESNDNDMTLGPIHGCQAFVPFMKNKNQCGLIVNTGSKQGITMPPGNLTYNVSKAALKTWTEGLEHELMTQRLYSGGKLRAALLVPGWVNTSIALKESRARAKMEGETFDEDDVFFHEGKPAAGAWMSKEVIDFMFKELNDGKFYIICPDNDVDRETDNARMTWAMQDITQNRPPLSRWHPEWKDKFTDYLEAHRKEEK